MRIKPFKRNIFHTSKEAVHAKWLLLLLLWTVCGSSCDRSLESIVPSYPVLIELKTDNTAGALVSPGGYMTFTQRSNEAKAIGYGGVLVIRGVTDVNEIYAYDLSCPVENKQSTLLKVKDGIKLCCDKCGSEFSGILYGNTVASSGPAYDQKRTIRRYGANYSGNSINVYN